jgi:hypothetical protein
VRNSLEMDRSLAIIATLAAGALVCTASSALTSDG